MPYGDCICEVPGCIGPCVTRDNTPEEKECLANEVPRWNWDYRYTPRVWLIQILDSTN